MNENGKRAINLAIIISMIFASLSILLFISDRASAGPIVVITVTGQVSAGAIENGNPGDNILFDVRVDNNGDATATINLTVTGTPQGWSTSLTGENFTVTQGGSQTEILTVSISSSALETAFASLTVKCTTNSRQDTCRVNVDQVFSLLYETATTIKSSLPDSTLTFTLPVNNTGNGVDTTSFTDTGAPPTWSLSYDTTKNLQPFSAADLEVAVYIPSGYAKGTYSVTVRGTSEDTVTYVTKTLTITVLAEYGLTVSTLPSGNLLATPGGKVTYTLNIENIGNARDRYSLSVDTGNKTNGWTATLGTAKTPQVSAGSTYNVSLYVTAPVAAFDTDLGYVNVTVTSDNNNSQLEEAFTITSVLQERYLSLSVDNSSVEGAQSDTVRFTFTLTNSGNGLDRVDITATPPNGWSSPNISPTYFSLSAGSSDTFTVDQAIPSNGLHQGYALTISARSRDDANVTSTSTVTVDVAQDYDVQVTIPGSNSKDASPGDTVNYSFDVKNKGNGEDTFSISQSGVPQGWTWALSDSSVSLAAAATQTVSLTVTVPNDYENFGPLEVELVAVSDGNATARDNSSKIIVSIQRTYNVILTCNNRNMNGYPENSVYYIITITNDGNAEDIIEISIDIGTYSDWASINTTLFTIAANGHSSVNLTVTIPVNQPAGYYYINVTATSQRADDKGINETDTMATRTRVRPLYEVYLFADGGNVSEVDAGNAMTYLLGVQNRGLDTDTFDMAFAGDFPFTNWISMSYDNYTVSNLARNGIKRISFDVTIPIDAHDLYPGITSGTITITATSRGDPSSTYSTSFETTVKAKYDGSLTAASDFDSALPGENVTFTVELKNTGSSANDTFGLEETDCPFDDITITPSIAVINSSAIQEFTIVVRIDADAEKDDFYFNVSARSAGADGVLARDDDIIATMELKIGVLQSYGVRVTCSDRTEEVAPQDFVVYEIEIENEGNGEDTYDVTKYSANNTHVGWATIDTSTVTLLREETTTVRVNVSIPHSVRPVEVIIFVNVTSREDNTASDNVQTITTVTQEFALALSSNEQSKDTDPGQKVQFFINVENEGTGRDLIKVSIVTETLPNGISAEIPSTMLTFYLEPSTIKVITLNVTPTEDQDAKSYPVKVRAESQNSPDELIEEIIATVNVKPKRDVALEITEARKEIVPNLSGSKAEVTYSLKVTNKGTAGDEFTLRVKSVSDNSIDVKLQTASISSLAADKDITIIITVIVPNNYAPVDNIVNAEIYVYSPGPTNSQADDIGTTINITVVINTAYGLELSASTKRKETPDLASPSDNYREIMFPFKVKNIGTGDDTIKFEVLDKPGDWDDVSIDLSTEDIAKGAIQNAILTARVDRDVAVGNYDIEVKVISRGDDSLFEDIDITKQMKFTVEVTAIHEIKLTGTQTSKEAKPGESVTYTITVKNRGNSQDTITLKLPNEIIHWGTRTISPTSVDLLADESIEITVTIRLSNDYTKALEGTYPTNVTATAGEGSEEIETFIMLSTTITQEYQFEISSDDWSGEGKVNPKNPIPKVIELTFEVKNKGNGPDSFKCRLTGDHVEWAVFKDTSTRTITTPLMEPGTSEEIDVLITIGTDFDEYLAEEYNDDIILTVTSEGDDTETDNSNKFTLTIEEAYEIELISVTGTGTGNEVTMNPVEDTSITYKIEATNRGNTDNTVKFSINKLPDDWVVTIPSTKVIEQGKTESVSLTISPDIEVEEGTYFITIRAKNEDKTGTYTDIRITVEIELPDLIFSAADIIFEEEVKAEEETVITVKIDNKGNADAEKYLLQFYDVTEKKDLGSEEFTVKANSDDELIEFNDWDVDLITEGKHTIRVTLSNQPSGEKVEFEKMVEVVGEEKSIWMEQKTMYMVGGIGAAIFILIIIILIFSRTKKPLPEDLKEEIAKAKAEADKERPKEETPRETDIKKVKKDEIEKLLTKKSLPLPKTQAALPESTEKEKEKPAKAVKIKCPKCDIIQTVTSPKRPLEFECEDCGMKLILKK